MSKVKVLHISSNNSSGVINPIILNQVDSLTNNNIDINHFGIVGNGAIGYIKNIFKLRSHLKHHNFDFIHAHYSFSGFVASLAFRKIPVIVSLMGSDIYQSKTGLFLIRIFTLFYWKQCIVKTQAMKDKVGLKKIVVIPNGVNLKKYKPLSKEDAIETLNWDTGKSHILFAANPDRYEKNVSLARSAIEILDEKQNIQLHYLKNVDHSKVPLLMNASDVIILCSLWEGSPNVIKEAMACNKPIVTTNVGDVEWLLDDIDGCFIATTEISDYSDKLKRALNFAKNNVSTKSRDRIPQLGLDAESIAKQIENIYKNILKS